MAALFERYDTWWIYFRRDGRRYRESTGLPIGPRANRRLAEDFLAKRQREVIEGEINGVKPESITFAAFADDFLKTDSPQKKARDRDREILEMFKAHFKDQKLDAITTKMIADFKAQRLQYRAAATVHKELTVLTRLFKMAIEWGRLTVNPAAPVKKPKVNNNRVRFLEPEELARLQAKLPGWFHPYFVMAWKAAARRGETIRLTWNDVDFRRGLLTFRDTKNGEDATVPMNRTIRSLLEALPVPIDRSQRVFTAVQDNATGYGHLRRAWEQACRAAKITNFRLHDLRHQAATDLISQGATLYDVQGFLRHRTTAMTARYAHLTDDRREQTARLLDSDRNVHENGHLAVGPLESGTNNGIRG